MAFGTCELRSDGILTFVPLPSTETVNLSQLKEMLDAFVVMGEGKPKPFFTDNRRLKSLGYTEREFIGKNIHIFASASAIAENSSVVRFISHTINHLFPPKIPMQLFSTKEDAIAWLKSLTS